MLLRLSKVLHVVSYLLLAGFSLLALLSMRSTRVRGPRLVVEIDDLLASYALLWTP